MTTQDFVKACKEERDALLTLYADQGARSAVGAHLEAAELTLLQRTEVLAALDVALTDAFYLLLMGLAGAGSLGNVQQVYRLLDQQGRLITPSADADLEAVAYEFFQSDE